MKIIDFVKDQIKNMKDDKMALRNMTDDELKEKALKEDSGIFDGWNKYEKELIRRAKNEDLLEKKLKDIREKKLR